MRLRVVFSVAAAASAVLASAAPAHASTEEQRRAWARSQPRVFSHDREHGNVCAPRGWYRTDEGERARAFGLSGCPDIYTIFPVHRDGRVVVETRREAQAVTLSIQQPYPRPPRDPRRCTPLEPGRWECTMPPPGGDGSARVRTEFPGAGSIWFFDYQGHSPASH